MNNKKHSITENTLIDYLEGKISQEDIRDIENWVDLSQENKETLEQVYFIHSLERSARAMETGDPDSSYDQFKQKISRRRKHNNIKKIVSFSRKIAALLTIPLLITSIYFYIGHEETKTLHQFMEAKSNIGMVSKVDLPDGSTVWLNSSSSLKFPMTFKSNERVVELDGEAFFEVEHNPKSPFIVKVSEDYSVKVVGTSFNVHAYEEDETIETTLVDGIVDLYVKNSKTAYRLKPGDNSVFNKKDKSLEINAINTYNQTAWRDGILIFKSTPMHQVLKVLERNYNVKFNLKNTDLGQSTLTAKFDKQQLYQILDFVSIASDIKFNHVERNKGEGVQGASIINVQTGKK